METNIDVLVLSQHSPVSSTFAREAIDYCLAAAAFEQKVAIVFSAEGVYQLLPQQQSIQFSGKSITQVIEAFPLYGIETIYVSRADMEARGLETYQLPSLVTPVSNDEIKTLIQSSKHVLSF